MSFYVECIDDRPIHPIGIKPLQKGCVYTVVFTGRVYGYAPDGSHGRQSVFVLAEVRHPQGAGFNVSRFRPLDPKRLDVFRRALVSPKKTVGA